MSKKNIIIVVSIMLIAYVVSMGICLYLNNSNISITFNDTTPSPAPTPNKRVENIQIVVMGDNLMHVPVFSSGKQEDGSYDIHHLYENFQPLIEDADLAVIGQETLLAGEKYGYTGFPCFNSPQDVGRTLVKEGFDLILCASNHAMDKGGSAVTDTISFWKEFDNVTAIGFNETKEQQDEITVLDIKGVKIAVLNYTYDTNGIPLPSGQDYLVNLIDKNKIEQDIIKAKEISDYIIVFPHWGIEYSITASPEQIELAQLMSDLGVDAIIGSHPHVMEPVEYITGKNGNKTVVYYSLGNFVSSQQRAVNLVGGVAILNIEATFEDEDKDIVLKDASLLPTITHYNNARTEFTVYPLKNYTDELASVNGVAVYDGAVSVERLNQIVYNILGDEKDIKFDY